MGRTSFQAESFDAIYQRSIQDENENTGNEWRGFPALGDLLATAVEQEIQPQGGFTTLQSVAGTLTATSDSASDTFGGTGANAVLITGLDGNYSNGGQIGGEPYYSQVMLMNGLGGSTAAIDLLRIQSARVILAGSNGGSVGTITFDIAGDVQVIIRPGDGQAKLSRQTCPVEWTCYTARLVVNWAANNSVRVDCAITLPDGTRVANIETSFEQSLTNILGSNPLGPTFDLTCSAVRPTGADDQLDTILVMGLHRRRAT